MARVGSVLTVAVAAIFMVAGCEAHPAKARGDNTAVMLIGYQSDYLAADGRRPVAQDQVERMIEATNAVVAAARRNAVGVFYVVDEASPFDFLSNQYRNGATPRLWAGSHLDPRADIFAGPDFAKHSLNAFNNPALEPWLNQQEVGRLVVAGAYVERSVRATAMAALRLGYKVTVVSDAVAGASDQWREQSLEALKNAGATIETSQQVETEMKPNPAFGLIGPTTGAWWLLPPAPHEEPK